MSKSHKRGRPIGSTWSPPEKEARRQKRLEQSIQALALADGRIEVFIPERVVSFLMGQGRSKTWEMVEQGSLPPPVRIGKSRRWPYSAIARVQADLAQKAGT
jgi:predicted DNA-binding transcriptional regulator AlpA